MIAGALTFLLQTLGNLFVIAVLLRFMMQLFRVPFRNPFAQFVVAVTDFAVKPLRRVVPGLFGLDWHAWCSPCWVGIRGGAGELLAGRVPVRAGRRQGVAGDAGAGGGAAAEPGVYLIIGLTLVRAVLSWVNSDTPLVPVVYELTEPFLASLAPRHPHGRQCRPDAAGAVHRVPAGADGGRCWRWSVRCLGPSEPPALGPSRRP